MTVLVCGGRDYQNWKAGWSMLDEASEEFGPFEKLVNGGAAGADAMSSQWGLSRGLWVKQFPADWDTHGKAAGPIRNAMMLAEQKPDLVVALPGGRGTADMVRKAKAAGVRVIEHPLNT